MIDRHIEQIYGYSEDPNEGKWFVSDNSNYVRYINGYREVIHQVTFSEPSDNPDLVWYSGTKWTVSIGGSDNKFQVGYKYFDNTTEAKKWADNRDQEDLEYLRELIERWRTK